MLLGLSQFVLSRPRYSPLAHRMIAETCLRMS